MFFSKLVGVLASLLVVKRVPGSELRYRYIRVELRCRFVDQVRSLENMSSACIGFKMKSEWYIHKVSLLVRESQRVTVTSP